MTVVQSVGSIFQSTLSMRRATACQRSRIGRQQISIHALHEESDPAMRPEFVTSATFQSTLSMRRATRVARASHGKPTVISIHALHEESDSRHADLTPDVKYFNPRSP